MGLFSDLAMGLGLKDRDASYYDRTAATLGRTQGADREAQYRQSRSYTEQPTRGGPAAMVGNILDRRQGGQRGGWGYGEGDQRVSALRDMLDGGGHGRAGQRFDGGMLADLANALGFRPLGYQERLAAARPMARPTRPQGGGGGVAEAPLQYGPQARPVVGPRQEPPPRPFAMGDWGSPVNMPTAPRGMFTSPLSMGGPSFPLVGGIYDSYMTDPDYTSQIRPSTLPVVTPTGGLPWVHSPLAPYSGNIRGTGTGGGGYGFPVVGTYTF
jgi:hypothetical protein